MGTYLSTPNREKISEDYNGQLLSYGASCMQGWRSSQEDAHNCEVDFDDDTSLFAVYDGHGGAEVAQYTASQLPSFLRQTQLYKEGGLQEALVQAFLNFDATLLSEPVLQELKQLAGVDECHTNDAEDLNEALLLREDAQIPIEQLVQKYAAKGTAETVKTEPHSATNSQEASVHDHRTEAVSKAEVGVEKREEEVGGKEDSHVLNGDNCGGGDEKSGVSEEVKGGDESGSGGDKSGVSEEEKIGGGEDGVSEEGKSGIKEEKGGGGEVKGSDEEGKSGEGGDSGGDGSGGGEETADKKDEVKEHCGDSSKEEGSKGEAGVVGEEGGSGEGASTAAKEAHCSKPQEDDDDDEDDDEDDDSDSDYAEEKWKTTLDEEDDDDDDDGDDVEIDYSSYIYQLLRKSKANKSDEDEDDDDDDDDDDDTGLKRTGFPVAGDKPAMDSGCTAVVALLRKDDLYVANAGDSRCVVCRGKHAVDMSVDHKPEDDEEKTRIERAGGKITFDGRVNGGLNLSRAIGDHVYKQNSKLPLKEQMITSLPDVKHLKLQHDDRFMVLACDGIWNVLTSQEVVDFVCERLAGSRKLSSICEELFDFCLAPDTSGDGTGCDNMTCIIVKFNQRNGDVVGVEEVARAGGEMSVDVVSEVKSASEVINGDKDGEDEGEKDGEEEGGKGGEEESGKADGVVVNGKVRRKREEGSCVDRVEGSDVDHPVAKKSKQLPHHTDQITM